MNKIIKRNLTTPIFTVTSIETGMYKGKEEYLAKGGSSRCWGWFFTIEEARESVKGNFGDMHEGSYDYVVIEKSLPQILDMHEAIDWYKWVYTNPKDRYEGRWKKIKKT